MRQMRMRQFRSRQDDYARWRAIRLPYGDQDFSTVIRYALNQLYRDLVENKPPHESGWKGKALNRCITCAEEKIVNDTGECLGCFLVKANSAPKVVKPSNGSTSPASPAAQIGEGKVRARRTTPSRDSNGRPTGGKGSRRKAGQKGR